MPGKPNFRIHNLSYHNAIKDSLKKLMKYYCRFDERLVYIIVLSKFVSIFTIDNNINIDTLEYCTHTSRSTTSNWHGEEQRNKLLSMQEATAMPRTGRKKP